MSTTPRNLRRKVGKYRSPTSQTPGKEKGDNCQCTPEDRFFARRSRSYKHRGYDAWCKKVDRQLGGPSNRRE